MKRKSISLAVMAFSVIAAVTGHGAILWNNPITGTNPNTSNPYTTGQTVITNITVSGIGRGSGITGSNADDRYNASSWNTGGLDTNAYFTLTLTPDAGFEIDLTDFVYTGQASGTGPNMFAFRSSVDAFTADIGTPTDTGTTISLTAPAYQNLTSAIEFRLYGWNASSVAGTYSVNDFTFNGAITPVPEPTTALLSGLGLLALLRRRR